MATARFERWAGDEEIPLRDHLRQKKAAKYFDRRAAAALVCVKRLLDGRELAPTTPIHWALGDIVHEDYGLTELREASRNEDGDWDPKVFSTRGMAAVSPLTQFKVLYNMPMCFLAMELGLQGDNSVTHGLEHGLLENAAASPTDGVVLLGATRSLEDGGVECVAALATVSELRTLDASGAMESLSRWCVP